MLIICYIISENGDLNLFDVKYYAKNKIKDLLTEKLNMPVHICDVEITETILNNYKIQLIVEFSIGKMTPEYFKKVTNIGLIKNKE